jgi:hypothetical protein
VAADVRLRVVADVTALIMLLVYIGAGGALYGFLAKRVSRGRIGALTGIVVLWAVLMLSPWPLTWIGFRAGWHVYDSYPTLQHQSWDSGLAYSMGVAMVLCYGLGFVGACIASWRLIVSERHAIEDGGAT